jgi:hypothetical protein
MRYFTKKFTSYAIAVYEKKFKKEPMDLIDVGNLSIDKMITAIRVGNGVKGGDFILSEEEAAEKIDNFLEDENNSIIDVYLQIMEEYDRDLKIFKGTGVTIDSIRKDLYSKVEDKTKTADVVEFPKDKNSEVQAKYEEAKMIGAAVWGKSIEEPKNELLPGETPKVDVNGNVTLDSEDVPTDF